MKHVIVRCTIKSQQDMSSVERGICWKSTKLRQLDGKSDKWSSALLEYFNGRTSRLEMLEIVRQ